MRPDPQDPKQVAVRVGPNLLVTGHPDGTVRLPLTGDEAPPQVFLFDEEPETPAHGDPMVVEIKTRGPEAFRAGRRWEPSAATPERWPRPPSTPSASSGRCGTP